MFKKMGMTVLVGCFALTAGLAAQASQSSTQTNQGAQAQTQGDQQPSGEQAAAPAVRVPGQAASLEERDAWLAANQAPTLAEKASKAEAFLKQYPNSGLTANAEYLIAMNCYQEGQVDDFIRHAEAAITELPMAFDLMSHLAFYYAETHRPDQAIERANRALTIVEHLSKPAEASPEKWVSEKDQILAEVNYALGRSYLEHSFQSKGEESKANLQKSITYLQEALKHDPQHDFANFRLALAERNTGNVTRTLISYGRCVAVGGVAAEPARQQIGEILDIVNKKLPKSQWAGKSVDEVVAAARTELLQSVADRQAERDHEIQLLRDQDALKAAAPPAAPASGEPVATPPPGR
ncbi:MAG: hypothetical protein WAO20_03610 [Acidobacteriota bacterium]